MSRYTSVISSTDDVQIVVRYSYLKEWSGMELFGCGTALGASLGFTEGVNKLVLLWLLLLLSLPKATLMYALFCNGNNLKLNIFLFICSND